jgi:hypothetical protein
MIFGKPEQKGKPAEAGTPMPSAATLPPTAAAPAPAAAAAPTPVPSTPVPLAAPTPGSAPAAAGSSAAPRERQTATIRYVDRPDVGETFADSITGLDDRFHETHPFGCHHVPCLTWHAAATS